MVHCHRELIHAQWKILMDDEFMEAYTHGIVLLCPDGLLRRFYLRIFTYSADYPEKYVFSQSTGDNFSHTFRILMASIRNLGNCPCPRCEIQLSRVHNVGMPLDRIQRRTKARFDDDPRRYAVSRARALIYEKGHLVNSAQVERLLKPRCFVPTNVRVFACSTIQWLISFSHDGTECLFRATFLFKIQSISYVYC